MMYPIYLFALEAWDVMFTCSASMDWFFNGFLS